MLLSTVRSSLCQMPPKDHHLRVPAFPSQRTNVRRLPKSTCRVYIHVLTGLSLQYEARQALKADEAANRQERDPQTSSALPPLPSRPDYTSKVSTSSHPAQTDHAAKAFDTTRQFQSSLSVSQQPSGSTSTQAGLLVGSWPEEWQRFAETRGLFESQASDPSPGEMSQTSQEVSRTTPTSFPTPQSSRKAQGALFNKPGNAGSGMSKSSKRKDRGKGEDRAEELAAANLRNPVDAMSLLVMAAGERKGAGAGKSKRKKSNTGESSLAQLAGKVGDGDETGSSGSRADEDGNDAPSSDPYQLSDFPLVKRGVLNTIEVFYYVNLFFTKLHPIFPLVPHHRIPRTEAQLTAFAKGEHGLTSLKIVFMQTKSLEIAAELHLTTVFILIASRLDQGSGNQGRIHEQTWEYMQELITRLVFGEEVSVGALEALLLLSGASSCHAFYTYYADQVLLASTENPPRALASAGNHREDFAEENRMSWNIVGLAVRLGCM